MKTSKDVIELFLFEAPELKTAVSNDFGELDENQLNHKPSPDKWSIGECIDHLIVSHDQYIKKIRNVNIEKIPFGKDSTPYKESIFGKLIIKSIVPENRKKTKTFKVFYPTHKFIKTSVVDDYSRSIDEFIKLAEKFKGYDLNKIRIGSPVSSIIRLNLGDAFLLHLSHDKRHINQANKVLNNLEVYKQA